jgi:3-deoxy-D-manno-octulosonic-acid transferase
MGWRRCGVVEAGIYCGGSTARQRGPSNQKQRAGPGRDCSRGPDDRSSEPSHQTPRRHPMYLLYSALMLLFFVAASPYFLYQAVRYRKHVGSLRQRLGYLPVSFNLDREESIWIHAVSVGETLTARALVRELKERYPHLRLFLSTTTVTGQQVARQVQGVDSVFYFPFDFGVIVRRTLALLRPRLFIMMETEIWPNLLRSCRNAGVRTVLVNGRISIKSYPRYRLVRPLFRRVLGHIDRFCVQGQETADRLIALGADPSRMTITGSLKFDSLEIPGTPRSRPADRVLRFFRVPESRPVLVAGSTMPGEEKPLLRVFERIKSLHGRPLLVIAPRRPERFSEVVTLSQDAGLRTVRRTDLVIDRDPPADVVVLDTIGELAQVYRIATVVFVGGSLVPTGGHNILEPAIFGKPIVFGPHMENFHEIARAFVEHDAAVQLRSASELEEVLVRLHSDESRRLSLGVAARSLVEANRGAKERTLEAVADLLPLPVVVSGTVRPFRRVH